MVWIKISSDDLSVLYLGPNCLQRLSVDDTSRQRDSYAVTSNTGHALWVESDSFNLKRLRIANIF